MTHRGARFLTRLYPPRWRARYGEEFQTFLESRTVPPCEALDVFVSAILERLAGFLPLTLYACVATIAAAGALVLTAGPAPSAQTINAHRILWLCWAAIEAASLVIFMAGVAVAAPVLCQMLRKPSRSVLWKLARPLGAGLMVLLWVRAAGAAAWGTAGVWVTLLGLGTFVEEFAGFVNYVVAHSELVETLGRAKRTVLGMAASILVTTIASAGYGMLFRSIVTAAFFVLAMLSGAIISGVLSAHRLFAGRIE